jgi:FKBP-type peptidyl-prolyl cis-trans isomerase
LKKREKLWWFGLTNIFEARSFPPPSMNTRLLSLCAAMSAISLVSAQDAAKPAAEAKPAAAKPAEAKAEAGGDPLAKVDMTKVSYFIGRNIGRSMSGQGFKPQIPDFTEGLQSSLDGKDSKYPEPELQAAMAAFQTAMQDVEKQKSEAGAKAGKDFLAANGKKEGVKTTASGLQYEVMKAAEGPKPKDTDTVKVHYHGTLIDGKVFDSSVNRGEPATFPLNGVIKGWTEGVQLMPVGSKFKFTIPAELAYGENGPPGIGASQTLVFEVELLSIEK